MAVYLYEGSVLLDGGAVAVDSACCCGESECDQCSGDVPSALTITFGEGTNIVQSGTGCDVDCDDWATDWSLPRLSQDECDDLHDVCADLFDGVPTAGCWYGRTAGLPCTAIGMTAQIISLGEAGLRCDIRICTPDNTAVISYAVDEETDCMAAFDGTFRTCGIVGGEPCDFIGVIFSELVAVTAS